MRPGERTSAGAALGAFILYLGWHSYFYNFDGVACAIAVELSDLPHLVHGNHLLYGLAALAFHKLWQGFGFSGPALVTMHVLNSLLGAAGIGVFCSTLLALGWGPRWAAGTSAAAALSFAWWFWSLEPQVYPLGGLFLLLAFRQALLRPERPAWVGFLQGIAILGHAGNVMWTAVAAYLLWSPDKMTLRRRAAAYAVCGAATVLGAYGLAYALIIRGSGQPLSVWLMGSAALTGDQSFRWHGGWSWEHLKTWSIMTARILVEFTEMRGPARSLGLLAALMALAAAAWGLWSRRRDRPVRAAGLWLGSYALLFVSWEPFTMVYRYTDVPALWLLAATALRCALPRPAAASALATWLVCAGGLNAAYVIGPRADPRNNGLLQEALWIKERTPENAWVTAVALDQVYIPYFGHRRPLNLRYFVDRDGLLARRLAELGARGEPVFVTSQALSVDGWDRFFARYRLAEDGRLGDMILYRVGASRP